MRLIDIPTTAHSPRKGALVDLIVWHWTGGFREAESVARIDYRRKKNRVSAHFTIGRDGAVVQSVELDRAAWHAGGSRFWDRRNVNARSVGVEICNAGWLDERKLAKVKTSRGARAVYTGRHDNPAARRRKFERYSNAQRDSIRELAEHIKREVPSVLYYTGHEDVLNRQHRKGAKLDPGPAFHWSDLPQRDVAVVRWDYDDREFVLVADAA